jgi:hypothetical protein
LRAGVEEPVVWIDCACGARIVRRGDRGGVMMRLARRASLVVVLLLTSLGTAFAECAWVLWQEYGALAGTSTTLSPIAAYSAGQIEHEGLSSRGSKGK